MAQNDNHLLLRIPMTAEPISKIIEKHDSVALTAGHVWFGVRGQAPNPVRLQVLMEQLERPTPTFFYALQRHSSFKVFQSSIVTIASEVPKSELQLVPAYYATLSQISKPVLWLKVGPFKEISNAALDLLQVESTGSSVLHAMKGLSSFMIISERSPDHRGKPIYDVATGSWKPPTT